MESKVNFSVDKKDDFMETYHSTVSKTLVPCTQSAQSGEIQDFLCWQNSVVEYNVPHGKQLRGRLVEQSYIMLEEHASPEDLHRARILGWCVEILHASFVIFDDIMDGDTTRRGRPCWHLFNNMGNLALNDGFLLEHYGLQLLRNHFGDLDVYPELLNQLLEVTYTTAIGQSIDTRCGFERNFASFSISTFNTIAIYKTSYYTVYLPVALAMIFAGMSKKKPEHVRLWRNVEEISKEFGKLLQIQDDYFDCYGDKEVIQKTESDVQEGKCTWIFVTAKQKCSPEQLEILLENYGSADPTKVDKVKRVYDQLKMKELYSECEKEVYQHIRKLVMNLEHVGLQTMFSAYLAKIYNRKF